MKGGILLDAARLAARGKVRGALPREPRQGDTPWTPGPLSLQPYVPERSSPSRVRCGKSFQKPKRCSSAAQKPRALDRSGPFRTLICGEGKGGQCKDKTFLSQSLSAASR